MLKISRQEAGRPARRSVSLTTALALLLSLGGAAAAPRDHAAERMASEGGQTAKTPRAIDSERERPAAVDGSQYGIVAPLYIGQGGFYSYLRLLNGSTTSSALFTVKVVGLPSGRDYGTATYSLPPRGGRQLSLSNVLVDAGAVVQLPDTGFSFYVQTSDRSGGYQHVTHSPGESYFENSTVCQSLLQDAIGSVGNRIFLWAVHTSDPVVGAYPSALDLHNYANVPVTYRLSLIDERSGVVEGQMEYQTQANASYTIPIREIERAVGWTPSASQIRANIMIEKLDGSAPQVLAGQTIINNALRVTLNMTTACSAPLMP
jgi:hypothetical protein